MSKTTTTTDQASILASLDLLDPDSAQEALHEMFFTYVKMIGREPVPEEVHDDICMVYQTFRTILQEKKVATLNTSA